MRARAIPSAESRPDGRLLGRDRRCPRRTDAARLPRIRGARTGAPVRAVSPLQLLVRPRLLHPVRRSGRARRDHRVRHRAARAPRRDARLLSLRRRLGRPPPLGIPLGISAGASRRSRKPRRGTAARRACGSLPGAATASRAPSVSRSGRSRDSSRTRTASRSPAPSTTAASARCASTSCATTASTSSRSTGPEAARGDCRAARSAATSTRRSR